MILAPLNNYIAEFWEKNWLQSYSKEERPQIEKHQNQKNTG